MQTRIKSLKYKNERSLLLTINSSYLEKATYPPKKFTKCVIPTKHNFDLWCFYEYKTYMHITR